MLSPAVTGGVGDDGCGDDRADPVRALPERQRDQAHRPRARDRARHGAPGAALGRVLRSNATAFAYKREVQPQPKLGPFVPVLAAILEAEAKLPRRERRSTQRLFEELHGRGYEGAHDSVHRFVKTWREERARVPVQAFVPLRFDPGEAYQFDWSHEGVEFNGLPLTVKVAQVRLAFSRMPFVRAYFR